MPKKLVIAEKPSVARDIAKALGGFTQRGKVFERDDYVVCSAAGHLVELCMPEDLDKKKYGFWRLEALPILPEKFPLKASEDSAPRYKRHRKEEEEDEKEGSSGHELLDIIEKEAKRKDVTCLVNACDAGREGELIFAYIIKHLGLDKPTERLWLQSMTPASIRKGFEKLLPETEKAGLLDAAMCRSESDWLVGINSTRAFTLRLFGRTSKETANLGRVQTPTLAILVEREKIIQNFVPKDYWTARGTFSIGRKTYEGMWVRPNFKKDGDDDRADRIWDKAEADAIVARCTGKPAAVEDKSTERREAPPMLFDLTSLQREANKRFGLSARQTLSAAQSLYERYKVLTYPRTDSKCLPEDYPAEVTRILGQLDSVYAGIAGRIGDPLKAPMARRLFDNSKISDHFALIPTGERAQLSGVDAKVYDLVVRRFLAAFLDPAVWRIVERSTKVGDDLFRTTAKVLSHAGWREAFGRDHDEDAEIGIASEIPEAPDGRAETDSILLEGFQTRPPARYNDASLLAAMENAGKLIDNEELAEAMKERGLGTPATRAETIEKLISSYYVTRRQRELVPTAKAMQIVGLLGNIPVPGLVNPTLTGEWEYKLLQMEKGEIKRADFMQEIRDFTGHIVEQARAFDQDTGFEDSKPFGKCPKCGKPVREKLKSFDCTSEDCDFRLFKTIATRLLTQEEAETLLEKGEVGPLDGFFSFKTRRPFSAGLRFKKDDAGNFVRDEKDQIKPEFVFEERDPKEPPKLYDGEFACPICGGPTTLRKGRFGPFLGCARYPECKGIVNVRTGPGGELIKRVPRKKKVVPEKTAEESKA